MKVWAAWVENGVHVRSIFMSNSQAVRFTILEFFFWPPPRFFPSEMARFSQCWKPHLVCSQDLYCALTPAVRLRRS